MLDNVELGVGCFELIIGALCDVVCQPTNWVARLAVSALALVFANMRSITLNTRAANLAMLADIAAHTILARRADPPMLTDIGTVTVDTCSTTAAMLALHRFLLAGPAVIASLEVQTMSVDLVLRTRVSA